MIYITGDVHGDVDIHKFNTKYFKEGFSLTKDDYVIVCGDFGLIWDNSKQDLYWQQWLENKPWTTLFLDGNHENFDLLYKYPIEAKFDGIVHQISNSIYHLNRGEIYTIENKKFFIFGGAESIDKIYRKEGKSWWKQEMPTLEEMNYGIDMLEKHEYNIDYVLTHTCPSDIFSYVVKNNNDVTQLERYFNFIKRELDEKEVNYKWYFGHYHQDKIIEDKFRCVYKDIILLSNKK